VIIYKYMKTYQKILIIIVGVIVIIFFQFLAVNFFAKNDVLKQLIVVFIWTVIYLKWFRFTRNKFFK